MFKKNINRLDIQTNRKTDRTISEFGDTSGEADLTLILEDCRIPVSKSILCIASPVFKAMLKSGFQETGKREIKLPGKQCSDFVWFLRCIYPDQMFTVTEGTVHSVLPLANEYQVQPLVQRCSDILLQVVEQHHKKGNVEQIYSNIVFAEKYNLTELKKKLISLASEYKLDDLNKAVERGNISDDIQNQIKDLALKRYELNSADDQCFLGQRDIKKYCMDSTYSRSSHSTMTVIRLLHRFCPGDEDLKRLAAELRHHSPDKREIDLLPETVKDMLKTHKYQKCVNVFS